MNYFFNKTMKTTSLNTIPFKSLLALLIQLKAKPKFKGQNEGGGYAKQHFVSVCKRSLPSIRSIQETIFIVCDLANA